jgi:hypothetical protein
VEKMADINEFGLTKEESEKIRDIPPTLNLGKLEMGQTVEVEFTEQKPRLVKFKEKATGLDKEQYAINCVDKFSGVEVTVWLSAKTLKQSLFNLYKKHNGSLKGVHAIISTRPYEHPTYGESKAYIVTEPKGKK